MIKSADHQPNDLSVGFGSTAPLQPRNSSLLKCSDDFPERWIASSR
jgi:hypothetical protein